ncbi:MAG TPA: response regulator transcription factor [Actinomycetota bacterium]|nr:response regulator transcription factor [Actinomycetota bacterium]
MTAPADAAGAGDFISVLIADDQALFRRAVGTVLDAEPDITLVGEASDGEEAIALCEQFAPDVVLMDVRMPKVSGIEATRRLKEASMSTRVVMLTSSEDEEDLFESVKAGASGYLLKDIEPEDVADTIRKVHSGQSMISPSMASKLLTEFHSITREPAARSYSRLTDREMEVLKLVAQGMTNREIGKNLHIAENTVKNHIRNILEKLHLNSRFQAVIFAVREKLLEIE